MNQFDKTQIDFLRPLVAEDACVVLHFSFYANTFPIAYHYNLLLEEKFSNLSEGKREIEIAKYLKPHDWSLTFPSVSNEEIYKLETKVLKRNKWDKPDHINLFYISDIKYTTARLEKLNPYLKLEKAKKFFKEYEKIDSFLFTEYSPRFVFLNNNLYTKSLLRNCNAVTNSRKKIEHDDYEFRIFENIKNEYVHLDKIINQAKDDGITSLNIYTETYNEAQDIIEEYAANYNLKTRFYNKANISSLDLGENHKNESKSLDIYFYGAPTSFHFLKRTERFIPVLLSPDFKSTNISTKACLHYNKGKYLSDNRIEKITEGLKKYHQMLFDTAISPKGSELLNNVRLAYNKYARLVRNDSFFYRPQSFANCIALHNNYTQEDVGTLESFVNKDLQQKQESTVLTKATLSKNIHFHYGAGKLGIGLVLPLIKWDESANHNKLIVLQKNKDEWAKKIQPDNPTVRFISKSNEHEWKQDFVLGNPDFSTNENNLVLFKELTDIKQLLAKATSISYSLNNAEVEKDFLSLLTEVNFENNQVLLFPFENTPFDKKINDKETGKQISERRMILERQPKISEVMLKADRICFSREISIENTVTVTNESHVEVVLNIDKDSTNNLFDITKNEKTELIFVSPSELKRFNFLSDRKKYLVNELHFILAVYGYDYLISKRITHWENQFITIIQSALTSDPEYKIPINAFIRLQIMRMLLSDDYNVEIIAKEYQIDESDKELICESLLKYADVVKKRFSESEEDQVSRVFNSIDIQAVEKKYDKIINVIEGFLEKKQTEIESLNINRFGTFLEYKTLIEDVKERIQNVFQANINNNKRDEENMKKLQNEKNLEYEKYKSRIDNLINKRKR